MKAPAELCIRQARLWPRELLFWVKGQRKVSGRKPVDLVPLLEESGIYILYRGSEPYYVGQATRLWSRLWSHARPDARYGHLWTHFTAYVVPAKWLNEIESILISSMPTANSATPRVGKEKLPREFRRILEAKLSLGTADSSAFDEDEDDGPEE